MAGELLFKRRIRSGASILNSSKTRATEMILTYLFEHPEAEDTLEGIVGWWLLKEEVKRRTSDVQDALEDLVGQGLVLKRVGPDQRSRYLLNRTRLDEVETLLKKL